MERIIFGDNQFFGINHLSEEKAQAQAERFRDLESIVGVVASAYETGIRGFMFNTHDRVSQICDHFRANQEAFKGIVLYPSMPYAHKYANAVADKGIVGALNDFLFHDKSLGKKLGAAVRSGKTIVNRDMMEVMKLLIDAEMEIFKGLNVEAIFLQNIVTDLLLGLDAKDVFVEFCHYIKSRYKAEPAFNTMNMPALVELLSNCGIENPIVCSSINKIGYFMSPNRKAYEDCIARRSFRPMAMSILASGAIPPKEAVDYIAGLANIEAVVFGASSRHNIMETKDLLEEIWH
jgi:hypothetical protein